MYKQVLFPVMNGSGWPLNQDVIFDDGRWKRRGQIRKRLCQGEERYYFYYTPRRATEETFIELSPGYHHLSIYNVETGEVIPS